MDWQPIETAPKDRQFIARWSGGKLFDLDRTIGDFVGIASWSKPERWPDKPESYGWRWCGDHLNFGEGLPTHWMPLPDEPSVERAVAAA
jgi:hypothetical protein